MITSEILSFLRDLKKNNNREWFHENKPRYNGLRDNYLHLVEILINEIAQFDSDVAGITAKQSIFRINRDIRFSKDKSPYKTNFGAFILKGGKSSGNAGYYLHIEPGNSFIAGGIYMPAAPVLKAIRQEIYNNTSEFKEILADDIFIEKFGTTLGEDKLKMAPKGFPKDFADIDLLKYKSYTVAHYIDDDFLLNKDMLKNTVEVFEVMSPFNKYLNQAVDSVI